MNIPFESKKDHQGYNVKRLREILGIKQESLAQKLSITQQAISKIEQKDIIENEMANKIAEALNIPVGAIKRFDEEHMANIFSGILKNI